MALNSRQKGKAGELEAAKTLRELFGWECGRSVQHSATQDAADLRVSSTPGLWFEVKRVEALSVPKTMWRAVEEAGRKCAVLLHRTNRSPVGWLLTIRLVDLPRLAHAYEIAQGLPMASPPLPGLDAGTSDGSGQPPGDARPLPCEHGKSQHSDQPGIGPHDVGNSTGRVGSRSSARVPGSVRGPR